jgi:pimeloyl-ACP methyl ester carboxylesterase
MSGLIVFIHGFKGGEEHWKYVPRIVAPAFASFEVKNLTYSAELNSFADMTRSGEQILTSIKTDFPDADPIFLVGYSMGGIIAREICLKLLNDAGEKEWLLRVRGVVTVGSGLWRDLFTDMLGNFVRRAHREGGKKVQIVNCLCDADYVDSIKWPELPSECSVFHLASPQYEHKTMLPLAGTISNCLLNNPEKLDELERTTRTNRVLYPVADFGEPPETHAGTEIAFEARIGDLRATD